MKKLINMLFLFIEFILLWYNNLMKNSIDTLQNPMENSSETIGNLQALLSEKEIVINEKDNLINEKDLSIQALKESINTLQHQLHQAIKGQFGRKSEKQDLNQQELLFDEAINAINPTEIRTADAAIHVPAHTRRAGRKPLPAELPRVEVIHDLSDAEKVCACGHALHAMGDERSEQLEYIPAKVQVIVNVRKKYGCKACEETIKTAAMPAQIIPKSIATPSLLAHVAIAKYDDHLPLYRQEEILQRHNIDIARNTLGDWMIRVGQRLIPLIKLLHHEIIDYDVAFADETPLQVLKQPGKTAKQKSYMWVFSGGPPDKQSIIYHYASTRSSTVPLHFFDEYAGYLHADGYAGYLPLIATKPIKIVACMAHMRRKFYAIVQTSETEGLAHQAMKFITPLYTLEKQLKEVNASSDTIKQQRHEKAKPIMDEMLLWLQTQSTRTPPKSPIGEAIGYALKQWRHFTNYLNDGRLEIDNNRSERAVKPFVIGRKHWLFAGNHHGAIAGANLMSLIETAKVHGLNPYDYLRYVFTHLPNAHSLEQLEGLLPWGSIAEITAN